MSDIEDSPATIRDLLNISLVLTIELVAAVSRKDQLKERLDAIADATDNFARASPDERVRAVIFRFSEILRSTE